MTIDIEEVKRDREAGTRGPWQWIGGSAFSIRQVNGPYVAGVHMWDVASKAVSDCHRIARVPDLEAHAIRADAIERAGDELAAHLQWILTHIVEDGSRFDVGNMALAAYRKAKENKGNS